MARSRTNPSLLEQSRPYWRRFALAGAVVLLVAGGSLLLRSQPAPEPVPAGAAPPLGRITIEVLNGANRQGAARTATRMLRHRGLDVVFLGNADSLADSTRVLARRGDLARAKHVANALGRGLVRVEIDTFRRVDVSVILGQDFSAPPTYVPDR